jgi:RHS repeat-associated protein
MGAPTLTGIAKAQYRYDWAGRQVIRMLADTGTTLHVTFDSAGNRLAEYDQATGSLLREYVWFEGQPIAVLEAGQVYLVRTDHIGRPSFATDQSGTVVWTVDYLPFGEVFVSTGTPINLRFPGQWFQAESGLHQNWMRDDDPTTGRYIQPDPLGLIEGSSVYGYAWQKPGRWIGPTGEQTVPGSGPLILHLRRDPASAKTMIEKQPFLADRSPDEAVAHLRKAISGRCPGRRSGTVVGVARCHELLRRTASGSGDARRLGIHARASGARSR